MASGGVRAADRGAGGGGRAAAGFPALGRVPGPVPPSPPEPGLSLGGALGPSLLHRGAPRRRGPRWPRPAALAAGV